VCRKVTHLTVVCFILVYFVGVSSVSAAIDRATIMGLWFFEEPGVVTDSGPYGYHGTIAGGPIFAEGPVGNAIFLDGVDDTVRKDRIGGIGWSCDSHASRGLRVRMDTSGGTNQVSWMTDGDTAFQDGQWHHVAWVINKGEVTGYLEGERIGGGTYPHGDGFASTQGNLTIGPTGGSNAVTAFDDIGIFSAALGDDDIMAIYTSGILGALGGKGAANPTPADEAKDIPQEVELGWAPGESATQHDVYFGTTFDDVNNATATVDPAGVYKGRQLLSSYVVGEVLDFGKTCYWRIDEVDSVGDLTIFKGDVWSFTVEPYAIPIPRAGITATASSTNGDTEGPENTINGSGLDGGDLHSSENSDMWLTSMFDPNTAWIQYEFDKVYKLHQMQVWNYNSTVSILGTTHEFARGPGKTGYGPDAPVDLNGVAAKHVRITANSNWGGFVQQYGLSEVRFHYVPVWAEEPNPNSGATDIGVDAILGWKAGREAAEHDVYLSTDEQAVIDGNAPAATVTEASYAPSLDLGSTYYWRVDEANDTESPTTWPGDVWNLSTQEYLVVEDFESYNDIEAGQEGSNLVYETWSDGFGIATNGSAMGYTVAFQPTMETSIVHDGRQSVPVSYDNTVAAYSEVTANVADLQAGQDWAKHGIKALTLRHSP